MKVRFTSFYTPIKSRKLPEITEDPEVVAAAALAVLSKFELRRPVRLLGVRVEFATHNATATVASAQAAVPALKPSSGTRSRSTPR